jgi:NAD(P)H-hydrate repair Nnr-like enzyme with NAD(P)H-hydrate dehydratase domain
VADNRVQAWLVGSGMGPDDHDQLQRARDAIASGLPVVADAGALPVLPEVLAPHVVLTPHAGELAALLKRLGGDEDRAAVEAGTLAAVRRAAALTRATVLLKGATTLVAAPGGDVFSQADGTPWLATAGSGDVLAGVIGALLAQSGPDVGRYSEVGVEPDVRWAAVAALGAALHGEAGRAASDAVSGGPIAAGGIAAALPGVWGKVSTLSNSGVRKRNSHTLPLR